MKSYFEALELPDLETRSTRKKGEAQKQFVAPGGSPLAVLVHAIDLFVSSPSS
jgi:hypothetical protein